MIESYMETMQNRNILENVLEDCKTHAESVERGFSTLAQRNYKPSILNKNMELHDYQVFEFRLRENLTPSDCN